MKVVEKKSYFIIGGTILFFVIVIGFILLNKEDGDWTTEIKNAQSYQIIMNECDGIEQVLDNNVLDELSTKWNKLSNNGPWTGDTSVCYTTVTLNYENNGIVKKKELVIIDDETIVLKQNTNTVYYTNASDVISYLRGLFDFNI